MKKIFLTLIFVVSTALSYAQYKQMYDYEEYRRIGGRTLSDVIGITEPGMKSVHFSVMIEFMQTMPRMRAEQGWNDDSKGGLGAMVGLLVNQPIEQHGRLQVGLAYSMLEMSSSTSKEFSLWNM